MTTATITLIEGPTALIELDSFRLLTDPTCDDYTLPPCNFEEDGQTCTRRGPDRGPSMPST
jgi:hypothetical protein